MEIYSLGSQYPHKIPDCNGAIAEFLKDDNTLLIALPGISGDEAKVFRTGVIKCSLLVNNGAIILVWQFCNQENQPFFTFDCPFDARLIKDINLPNIENKEHRALIHIHAVDSDTNAIVALRSLTMPPDLTLLFLSAVQDQLASSQSGNDQMKEWLQSSPHELFAMQKSYLMGM